MNPSDFDPDAAAPEDAGLFGLPFTPEASRVVILPVPFEATTSYGGGTANGPEAVLAASHQVDLFDLDYGRIYRHGIAMLPIPDEVRAWNDAARALAEPVIAHGGAGGVPELESRLAQMNDYSARLNAWVRETASRWLDAGHIVGVLGGDHAVPWGNIAAHAERHPGLGILHLDAHADLRVAYEGFTDSHASIMHNVLTRIPGVAKLVQVGIRDFGEAEYRTIVESGGRVQTFFDADLARRRFEGVAFARVVDELIAPLPEKVYLSFDIDGLDPTLCPHTGTPVPGGLQFQEAAHVLLSLARSGREIVGFDLCEVSPGPDGDEWDANVGARLLYKMIGATLRSRGEL
jgi:agmatinase